MCGCGGRVVRASGSGCADDAKRRRRGCRRWGWAAEGRGPPEQRGGPLELVCIQGAAWSLSRPKQISSSMTQPGAHRTSKVRRAESGPNRMGQRASRLSSIARRHDASAHFYSGRCSVSLRCASAAGLAFCWSRGPCQCRGFPSRSLVSRASIPSLSGSFNLEVAPPTARTPNCPVTRPCSLHLPCTRVLRVLLPRMHAFAGSRHSSDACRLATCASPAVPCCCRGCGCMTIQRSPAQSNAALPPAPSPHARRAFD